ncbi:YraN family protein [Caldichromatium japonicum]|uniref:UPF0102 protein GWK36_10815 n=1 Tax=Caldichromatium japonicum TaxID=2699430 RepID=A0A6G7VF18_9GAMM|nr:YraN family protein [Caldichromatium japonicum]QIK38387.1 YraN family protein [Caldichromatium japonicum]
MSSPDQPRQPDRRIFGQQKELLAESFLLAQGLVLIARNHRCRFGEIDLVMRDAAVLVFVEVRYRRSAQFGGAAASVDTHKQQRLIQAARDYLMRHPTSLACRFDVVAIGPKDEIQWIKQAFSL